GGGEEAYAGVDLGQGAVARQLQHRFDAEALAARAIQQLVVDAEARLRRQVVGGMEAGEEAIFLPRGFAEPAEHGEDLPWVDEHGRLPAVEGRVEDGPGVLLIDLPTDQLQSGGVRHGPAPSPPRRPGPPRGWARCAGRRAPTPRSRRRRSAAASPG